MMWPNTASRRVRSPSGTILRLGSAWHMQDLGPEGEACKERPRTLSVMHLLRLRQLQGLINSAAVVCPPLSQQLPTGRHKRHLQQHCQVSLVTHTS